MITKSTSGGELCALCNRNVPAGALLLRKEETNKGLCLPCLVEIAELSLQQPVASIPEDKTH